MKETHKEVWIFLILLWGIFLVWEYQILNLPDSVEENGIRYDLLVLPILVFSTVYILKKNKR